jgi:8-oxo-dGTP pyrophosphatase MutT (NUDIX family)
MEIKIYFDNKPVLLCDKMDDNLGQLLHQESVAYLNEVTDEAFVIFLNKIKKDEIKNGIVCHADFAKIKDFFFAQFTPIEAAGGIVHNEKDELLFIFRNGKWDLPKGKIEENESTETAAIREVEEETGASGLIIEQKAGETFHTYQAYGKYFIKTTHWFNMKCKSTSYLTPQTEEGITEIKWVNSKNIQTQLSNTFASIKEILENI